MAPAHALVFFLVITPTLKVLKLAQPNTKLKSKVSKKNKLSMAMLLCVTLVTVEVQPVLLLGAAATLNRVPKNGEKRK